MEKPRFPNLTILSIEKNIYLTYASNSEEVIDQFVKIKKKIALNVYLIISILSCDIP
jgi:hypothetical protein